MDLVVAALACISVTAIIATAVLKVSKMRLAARAPDELEARVETLEGTVHNLQHELAEAQERIDFAERLLTKGPQP
ncbi:MAG: hypothetical protein ABR537_01280 [Gemmatimonadales bacterium]